MARGGIKITGLKRMARKIEVLAAATGQANVSGMRVIAEMILTDVKASRPGAGVPRDEGHLARSGRVTGPHADGSVGLEFGGAAAPYALRQHEELTYRHTVGEARYLIRALERFVAAGGPTDA